MRKIYISIFTLVLMQCMKNFRDTDHLGVIYNHTIMFPCFHTSLLSTLLKTKLNLVQLR